MNERGMNGMEWNGVESNGWSRGWNGMEWIE